MHDLLGRVRSVFIVPAPAAAPAAARLAPAPSVGLLCPAADALADGSALVLALAREAGARRGLLSLWRADVDAIAAWRAPGFAHSRRLVAALAAHGLPGEASGRLVRLTLPDDPGLATADASRAAALAAAPSVGALAGPRSRDLDRLLSAQDLVVVATRPDADAGLALLAAQSVAELGVATIACELAPRRRARMLAAAGLTADAELRSVFAPALEVVRG